MLDAKCKIQNTIYRREQEIAEAAQSNVKCLIRFLELLCANSCIAPVLCGKLYSVFCIQHLASSL